MFQSIVNFFTKDEMQSVVNDMTTYKPKYIGIAIAVFALFVFLKKIFAKYVFKIILRLVNKTKFNADTKIVAAFQKPVTNFFEVLGFYFGSKILIIAGININIEFIDKVFSSAVIIIISWGLYNLTEESSLLFERMHKAYDIKVDKILFPFMSKTLRLILIALVITIIAETWGYNIQGFVTGLGLGGLAFALAAKDAAANVIAGIFIILDKPFTIGDWVSNNDLEGSIESISFRTTKIRTIDEALIIVPNSKLTNEPVTNFSRRGKRRVSLTLELTYKTPRAKVEICVTNIRNMLEADSKVSKDGILVRFDKFNATSLDILVCFFADTPDYDDYFKVKEDVNFKIIDILQQGGVAMAYETTSVYMEKSLDKIKEEI
ncbi:mechanosensitive ion channel family protein [Clostridium lacusfryxellense]|uniref:mechanosensitive ion channel family protein n=1 Tax=Clostridium lacusfryxellense TaxID=205328 RepID=UPI001C0CD097|nr:mechanosensitive ion channel family protein [Clostridium lacusfryxellense]MBU3114282.1 mechanosensitive ion channel family protein [Clostridium lacusfryxellense]